jgi:protein-L-isoaspartate(D-aspartate) O-methyltransferase
MNFELARFNMVEQQVRSGLPLRDDVRQLLLTTPRECFVPAALRQLAFADTVVSLGARSATLPPRLEAAVIQALAPRKHESALEIGTGSGYGTALLAARAEHVVSYEIDPLVAAQARRNLAAAGVHNVDVIEADGLAAQHRAGSFGLISLSGGVGAVPENLLAALKSGGRLAAFVGQLPCQQFCLVTRASDTAITRQVLAEAGVPMLQTSEPAGFTL